MIPHHNPFFPMMPPARRFPTGPLMCLERDGGDLVVTVTGKFVKGCAATGPSYASGGEPGEPDRYEKIEAYDETGRLVELSEAEVDRAEKALFRWEGR